MKTTVFEKGKQKMNAIKGASAVALGSAVALAGAALPVEKVRMLLLFLV